MTAALLGWVVFGGVAEASSAKVVASTGVLVQLAGFCTWPRPADPPETQTLRARLAAMVKCQVRHVGRVAVGTASRNDLENLVQVTLDACDVGAELSGSAAERVAWRAAGLNQALAMRGLRAIRPPDGPDPPGYLDPTEGHVELLRSRLAIAVGEYLSEPGR